MILPRHSRSFYRLVVGETLKQYLAWRRELVRLRTAVKKGGLGRSEGLNTDECDGDTSDGDAGREVGSEGADGRARTGSSELCMSRRLPLLPSFRLPLVHRRRPRRRLFAYFPAVSCHNTELVVDGEKRARGRGRWHYRLALLASDQAEASN